MYWYFDSNNKLCLCACAKIERHVIELKKKQIGVKNVAQSFNQKVLSKVTR